MPQASCEGSRQRKGTIVFGDRTYALLMILRSKVHSEIFRNAFVSDVAFLRDVDQEDPALASSGSFAYAPPTLGLPAARSGQAA